jgi:hypothetical protein
MDAQSFSAEVTNLSLFSAVGPIPTGYTSPRAERHLGAQSEQQSASAAEATALSSLSAIGPVGMGHACPRLPGGQSEQQSFSAGEA